jgi:hypothetical protein
MQSAIISEPSVFGKAVRSLAVFENNKKVSNIDGTLSSVAEVDTS